MEEPDFCEAFLEGAKSSTLGGRESSIDLRWSDVATSDGFPYGNVRAEKHLLNPLHQLMVPSSVVVFVVKVKVKF